MLTMLVSNTKISSLNFQVYVKIDYKKPNNLKDPLL